MSRRSAEAQRQPAAQEIDWQEVFAAALEAPGHLTDTYSRGGRTLSFLNYIRLLMQGAPVEPTNNYKGWLALNRQVQKGEKAYRIVRPIVVRLKELDERGEPKTILKFKEVASEFTVSQTDGEPLPEFELPEWSSERALGALAISRVPYEMFDGSTQGYSFDRNLAINPIAKYPKKTVLHEMAHIVLQHTLPEQLEEYQAHRGIKEVQAEGVAFLVAKELPLASDEWDEAESRFYMQSWKGSAELGERAIKQVLSATDAILRAGREQPPITE